MVNFPPSLILSLAIAVFYGALFHLLWGRTAIGLLRALGIAMAGFLAGDAGARLVGSSVLMIGDVHLGIASVTAWAGLVIDHWRSWGS
ncbi:MAG: hypothetical protein ACE5LU_10530 [Anaerolineae bacterium]